MVAKENASLIWSTIDRATDDASAQSTANPLRGIITIRYRIGGKYNAERNLFYKADVTNPCAIIVANIPAFIEPETVKAILMLSLNVEVKSTVPLRGTNEGDPTEGYYMATASFATEYFAQKALKCEHVSPVYLTKSGLHLASCGSTKYCREYKNSFKSFDELNETVNSFIKMQDEKIANEKRLAKEKQNKPDEEGWITVTRSRYKRLPAAVVVTSKNDTIKTSKKTQHEIPFYSFQIKQSKLKHMEELQKRFEEDKKKLAVAKAVRKFRPN